MNLSEIDDYELLRMFIGGGADLTPEAETEICRRFMPDEQIKKIQKMGKRRAADIFEWHAADILLTPEIEDDHHPDFQHANLHYVSSEREWYIVSRGATRRPDARGYVFAKGEVEPIEPLLVEIDIPGIIDQGAIYDRKFRPYKYISEIIWERRGNPPHTMPFSGESFARNLEWIARKYLPDNQLGALHRELHESLTPDLRSGFASNFARLVAKNIDALNTFTPIHSRQKCDNLLAHLNYTSGEHNEIHHYIISRQEPGVLGSTPFGYVVNAETGAPVRNGRDTGYQPIFMGQLLGSGVELSLAFRDRTPMVDIKKRYGIPLEDGLTVAEVLRSYDAYVEQSNEEEEEIEP